MGASTTGGGTRQVFVHVGLAKTGTSYLQHLLYASAATLAEQGLDLVPDTRAGVFQLMLRVRGRYNPAFDPPSVVGALDALPGALRAAPGSRALLTQESLARGRPDEVTALLEALGSRQAHLVVTVRDLARQIPSAWQESVKTGLILSFPEYVEGIIENRGKPAERFWANQDLVDTLERWAPHFPPERIHVVTVPQRGSDPRLLLRRFCDVIDVDPEPLPTDVPRLNVSLGHAQAELLRRVNRSLPPGMRRRDVYGPVGKRYLAGRVLRAQEGVPPRLHTSYRDWCVGVAERYAEAVRSGGYHVVGDLAELAPADDSFKRRAVGRGGHAGRLGRGGGAGHHGDAPDEASTARGGSEEACAGRPTGQPRGGARAAVACRGTAPRAAPAAGPGAAAGALTGARVTAVG